MGLRRYGGGVSVKGGFVEREREQEQEQDSVEQVRLTGVLVCASEVESAIVRQYLPEHIVLTRAEPGCVSFEVLPTADPMVWQVAEIFSSSHSFRAHQSRVAESEWGHSTAGIERRYTVEGLS